MNWEITTESHKKVFGISERSRLFQIHECTVWCHLLGDFGVQQMAAHSSEAYSSKNQVEK